LAEDERLANAQARRRSPQSSHDTVRCCYRPRRSAPLASEASESPQAKRAVTSRAEGGGGSSRGAQRRRSPARPTSLLLRGAAAATRAAGAGEVRRRAL